MNVTKLMPLQSEKRMAKKNGNWVRMGVAAFCVALLPTTGCKLQDYGTKTPTHVTFPAPTPIVMGSPVGVSAPPIPKQPPTAFDAEVAVMNVVPRPDIFSLFPQEKDYDRKATNQRVALRNPDFPSIFVPHVPIVKVPTPEPQPFRRLAGVLVGDSVMAIIDMGDGGSMQVIRPGMQIPNSPWKVVSINETEAHLHRDGDKRPNDIVVHLQGPQGPGGFTPQPTGNPGFGNPGGNPGGNGGRNGGRGPGGKGGGGGGIE